MIGQVGVWLSFTPSSSSGAGDGSAIGELVFGLTTVHVTYAGDVYSGGGLSTTMNGNYYTSGLFTPPAPGGGADNISNDGGAGKTHTMFFDVPVVNPHFHVISMGNPGLTVDWIFSADFAVLSGNGISRPVANTLRGREHNGSIGFTGVFTQLSWTTPIFENTTGFQFTVDDVAPVSTTVPEPASGILLGGALAVWAVRKHRRA